MLVLGALSGLYVARRTAPPAPLTWMSLLPPGDNFPRVVDPAVSPDGRAVAFVTSWQAEGGQLYVRELGSPAARAIEGAAQ
ncbi:hypothetical protein P7A58_15385, partial [Clostridium perfringens]|nr:hypothetical protein [Clostridium perfringens]